MVGILDIEAGRAAVCAATASLSGISGSVFAVADAELGPFFRQVDDLSRQLEAARVAIVAEALPVEVAVPAADEAVDAPAKPKRRKTAAEPAAVPAAEEAGDAPAKPKRRKTAKSEQADDAGEVSP